jgi:predicted 2-oxoglutarate/Fe(II)-dependent dioxygenase YbiX
VARQKSNARRFEIGDPIPRIVLPTNHGGSIDFSQQFIAGNTLLLWFVEALNLPAAIDALTDNQNIFLELETKPYIILTSPLNGSPSQYSGFQTILVDRNREISTGLGVGTSGIVILGPNSRFEFLLPTEGLEIAIDACREIHNSTQETEVLAQAPVLIVPSVLDPLICEELIGYWGTGDKLIDTIASNADGSQKPNPNLKKRHDVALLDKALYGKVKNLLTRRLLPEIFKGFGFISTNMEGVRIGCYDSENQGFFGRHRDNRTRFTAHRKFAVSLNLSENYEGGQVRFPEYGRLLYSTKTGGAIVFSCSLLHEALPVTEGKRFAIFTFLTDSEGEAMAKKMRAQEGDAVKAYHMQD